jgi:uncharacterized damage-inducible protein DinB
MGRTNKMVSTDKLLRHMAWANTEVLSLVAQMPDEALGSYAVNTEWTAAEIIHHLVRSSHFYGYRLQVRSPEQAGDVQVKRNNYIASEKVPTTAAEVRTLVDALKKSDQIILEESREDEGIVYLVNEEKLIERSRSTIIFQAVHHVTEHRAQLVSALEARGYNSINLDDFDFWAFADKFGE